MANKDFSGMNLKLKRDPRSMPTDSAVDAKKIEASKGTDDPKPSENPTAEKKSVGRPRKKHGEYKSICIQMPIDMFEDMKIATAIKCNGNLTTYICTLIENDLRVNLENYKQLHDIKKNLQ